MTEEFKKETKRWPGCLVFSIIGILFIGYSIYTSIRAYAEYGYYVHVSDESAFHAKITPNDSKIIRHGRMLKDNIFRLDKEVDGGDGQKKGKVRWYICFGPDAEEGWESHFHE